MIAEYVLLAGRIRRELSDLDRAVARADRAARVAQSETVDSELYIDAAALNLHGFYTGLERAFQQIAEIVDESIPAGAEWHRALLEQMCIEFPGVRPAVLSSAACQSLSEFMRFRHVVRNVYAYNLNPERVLQLVEECARLYSQIKVELSQFALLLEEIGGEE